MAKNSGLGMGLDALFDDGDIAESSDGVKMLRVSQIEPNKMQPRQHFDESSIAVLADSIKQHGLIQPILVRETEMGYQIVAGERRWRACRMIGMSEIPVIIKEYSDYETAQIALIENIQREDLNPIEEALAYRELMEKYEMTQESLSKAICKSRSTIANSVRLLNMPDEVQNLLISGELSVGQAKAIGAAKTEEEQISLAKKAANGQITVRGIEKQIQKADLVDTPPTLVPQTDNFYREIEVGMMEQLGRKVKVRGNENGVGTFTIDFYDKDDLVSIINRFTK